MSTLLPTGRWISLAVTAPVRGYRISYHHWWPITTTSGPLRADDGSACRIACTVRPKTIRSSRAGAAVQPISSLALPDC